MRVKKTNRKFVSVTAGLSPKVDPVFIELFKRALSGDLPTYLGCIPLRLIHPFDREYCTDDIPDGRRVSRKMERKIDLESAPAVWVYPKDGIFILSDDYFAYAALRNSRMKSAACFILGGPLSSEVENLVGPLSEKRVMEAMGIEKVEDGD